MRSRMNSNTNTSTPSSGSDTNRTGILARRTFLQTNAVVTLGTTLSVALPRRPLLSRRATLRKALPSTPPATTLRDPRVKAVALQAVDAARSAGAQYADVRMTNTVSWGIDGMPFVTEAGIKGVPPQHVQLGLSVRALVNGYWGWAATPLLSVDEAVRVARLSTQFASATAARGKPRTVDLGKISVVQDGEWTTPVKIDPFTLDPLDMYEWMYGTGAELTDLVTTRGTPGLSKSRAWIGTERPGFLFQAFFEKQERVFASTDGAFLTQTVITTLPALNIRYVPRSGAPAGILTFYHRWFSQRVQAGFEWITEASLLELAREQMDIFNATPNYQPTPIDVGRYDCVFSAAWMAQLLNMTLAPAAQVDRVLGYEASATGTSYLGSDPLAILGTAVASPLVNITAERSTPIGMATARWDDEGVATQDFPLVKDGTLVNYPTTREQATWLAPWSEEHGQPIRSLGCARAPSALERPMQHTPNLMLHAGSGSATEASLVADLEHGLHFDTGVGGQFVTVDWQARNIYTYPTIALHIRHGKTVGYVPFGTSSKALMINTDQFWKHIETLGGPASAEYTSWNPSPKLQGFTSEKGNPVQSVPCSIGAVPARVAQLPLVDPRQR